MTWSQSTENGLYFCNEKQPGYQAELAIKAAINEGSKGCTGKIFSYPISSIEPSFELFNYKDCLYDKKEIIETPKPMKESKKYSFVVLYFGINDSPRWLFGIFEALSSMCAIDGIFFFEIIATNKKVQIQFCSEKKYSATIESALKSRFANTEVLISNEDFLKECLNNADKTSLVLESYYPYHPYYRNAIAPISKQQVSQLHVILQSASILSDNEFFYYRVPVESSKFPWDKNAANFHDYESRILSFYAEANLISEWQASPFSESKRAISEKLNPERTPFFFIQPMIVLFGKKEKFNSMKSFLSGYRFGDRSYQSKSQNEFFEKIGKEQTIEMIEQRNLHMQGHFVNRFETSIFMPFPCIQCHQMNENKLLSAVGRPIPKELQTSGILLGTRDNAGTKSTLRIAKGSLQHSLAIIGAMGFGKSNLLLNTISQIAESNNPQYAMILFYFQDFDFVAKYISRIPDYRINNVILAMPMLDGKVLKKNIVDFRGVKDISLKASDLAYSFESGSASFGIDVRFVIKNLLQILMLSGNVSLASLFEVILPDSEEGKNIRRTAFNKTKNPLLKKYIRILDERGEDEKKIFNKLQQFFDNEETAMMAHYSGKDEIDYADIIENKKILIWYLGGLGEAGSMIASVEVAHIHQHFFSYDRLYPKPYHPAIVAIDEIQRIKARGVSDSVREDRKHGLSYIFSTQATRGIDPYLSEAIQLIPNLAYFQCPEEDAKFFSNRAGGMISSKQIAAFEKYDMVVRLLSAQNVYSCTPELFTEGNLSKVDIVKQNSLKKYYADVCENSPHEFIQEKSPALDNLPEAVKKIANKKTSNKRS